MWWRIGWGPVHKLRRICGRWWVEAKVYDPYEFPIFFYESKLTRDEGAWECQNSVFVFYGQRLSGLVLGLKPWGRHKICVETSGKTYTSFSHIKDYVGVKHVRLLLIVQLITFSDSRFRLYPAPMFRLKYLFLAEPVHPAIGTSILVMSRQCLIRFFFLKGFQSCKGIWCGRLVDFKEQSCGVSQGFQGSFSFFWWI